MDWRSVKFDWNHARAFLVTAEEGSLSAAARALGMTQPTLGRQVDALEQELDVVLFERVGRGLTLTPSGQELLESVRAMGAAASELSLSAAGQSQSITGVVAIAVSELYAAQLLPPTIAKIRSTYPGIKIEVVASNEASDLRRREADIAIRNFRPRESDLVAKKVADVPAYLYATPEYLDKIGNPTSPEGLADADFVSIDSSGAFLAGLNSLGLSLSNDNFPVVTKDYNVMWEYVKHGIGIGVCDGRIGDAEPSVRRVLLDLKPLVFPIWLVAHRELNTSRRIRLVFDFLAEELRDSL